MSAFGTLLQFWIVRSAVVDAGPSRYGKLFAMFLKLPNHTTDNDSVLCDDTIAQTISIAFFLWIDHANTSSKYN
jgi:hypothetical protein